MTKNELLIELDDLNDDVEICVCYDYEIKNVEYADYDEEENILVLHID